MNDTSRHTWTHNDIKKIDEIANRIYKNLAPWDRTDTTPDEIANSTRENPLDCIIYLLDIIEN